MTDRNADPFALFKPWKQTATETAESHRAADKDCGRKWECQCGACRAARKEGWVSATTTTDDAPMARGE